MTNSIIQKIQKLLSLANSDNENEAKAAMNMANSLILKHNLSLQQISGYQAEYQRKEVGEALVLKYHQRLILSLLTGYFFVECVIKHTENKVKIFQLIGTAENCEIASYIFDYLDRAFPELWKVYLKNNPQHHKHKKSYYSGLNSGIESMLETTKFRVQEETGLILKEDANLKAFVKSIATKHYSSQARHYLESTVYNNGLDDGKKITLRKPIKSGASFNQGCLLGLLN